jgi:gliding motility-associated-like protein
MTCLAKHTHYSFVFRHMIMMGLMCFGLIFFPSPNLAQGTFPMFNGKLSVCKGIFEASGNGQTSGHYDHNEQLLMTICVPGADFIDWRFLSFCTELDFDVLKAFSGKDTFGTLIGQWSGTTLPSSFRVNDSCITFFFQSDGSVSCTGWQAEWASVIRYFPPPSMAIIDTVSCKDMELDFFLDIPIHMDSVTPGHITLVGPNGPMAISGCVPLNSGSDSMASRFRVTTAAEMDKSGNYQLRVVIRRTDLCDSLWTQETTSFFTITDCPIEVTFNFRDSSVCFGQCVWVEARVTGGNEKAYRYDWLRGGLTGPGPHWICITTDSVFVLEVTDGFSPPDRDSMTIVAQSLPHVPNDTGVCESSPPFQLQSFTPGGIWSGTGITNGVTGLFNPMVARPGTHRLSYRYRGCSDSFTIVVMPMRAGPAEAACPGSNPFLMSGFAPIGGYWTGPWIDSSGQFSPQESGQFLVTYHWMGCSSSKWVYVDSLTIKKQDTSCLNSSLYGLTFSPPGGIWSGAGIVNARLGRFNPSMAGPGFHELQYRINGCRDTATMKVVNIDAGNLQTVCPTGGLTPIDPPPTPGGQWEGDRLSVDSMFNPDQLSNGLSDSLKYHLEGCVDIRVFQAIQTQLSPDTLSMCPSTSSLLLLSPPVMRQPLNGIWSGDSVSGVYFNLPMAVSGDYMVYYHAHQCKDSMVIRVQEKPVIQADTSVCRNNYVIPLYSNDPLGRWSGSGITAINPGQFNPAVAGVGIHSIVFQSSVGCRDTTRMEVTALPPVVIQSPSPVFCYNDTLILLRASPDTGFFSGAGMTDSFFNPRFAGEGQHRIRYQTGMGNCVNADSITLRVRSPLRANILSNKSTFCPFEGGILEALTSGGVASQRQYQWSSGQINVESIYIFPSQSSSYILHVWDGCSQDVRDTFDVIVEPLPLFVAETSLEVCPGEVGYVKINPLDTRDYRVNWTLPYLHVGDSLSATGGSYCRFQIKDINTGCLTDSGLTIPVSDGVKALFNTTVSTTCISPQFEFLPLRDLSSGGTIGFWRVNGLMFGPYVAGQTPEIPFPYDSKKMELELWIQNDMGCKDSFSRQLCILDTVYVYIPTAFSPNGDGQNDVFSLSITAVKRFQIEIYNRWGELIFESNDPHFQWDGTIQGVESPVGAYMYKVSYSGFGFVGGRQSGILYLLR